MELIELPDADAPGLVVKPDVAQKQLDESVPPEPVTGGPSGPTTGPSTSTPHSGAGQGSLSQPKPQPKRFHGKVSLDAARVGLDASRIAEEVIGHLAGLIGTDVKVVLEVEAAIPDGAPDHVVRTVTENARTLKFEDHGFEQE